MARRSLVAGLIGFGLILAACGGGGESESEAESATDDSVSSTTEAADVSSSTTSTTTAAPVPDVSLDELIPALDTVGSRAAMEIDATPIQPMCPGWDQSDGLTPTETAVRTFQGDPVSGPFLTIGLLDFPAGEAEAYLDAHIAGAAGPCAQYDTVGAAGNPLSLGWAEVTGAQHGDRTVTMEVRGDSSGFPVNSDVVLIRVGDRVGYIGYLVLGSVPDAKTRDAAVSAIVSSLDGENVGVVEVGGSATAIAAALPGLEELGNPELLDEAFDAALPNGQCPSNPTTLQGLTVLGSDARRFLANQDFGPHVTVSILEFAPGEADEFIDRWVAGAEGPCTSYVASGLDIGWSVGSGPTYLDRTVTLVSRGRQVVIDEPAAGDYVLIRSGDFVGYMHYFLVGENEPNSTHRDTMSAALVEALEQVTS